MRLLVIEDDQKIAAALKRGLSAEGFAVEVSHNGNDGLWLACEADFDLVILDILLPGRNGYQVCAEMRAAGVTTPVLMLTAKGGELDEAEGLDTGADDYLTKPFSFPVLVARVKALLRRSGQRPPGPLTVGDLVIDPAARRVWRGGVEIRLTSREFDVLVLLADRPGEVISKQQILDRAWDMNFEGDANVVEVFISRLRRKVDDPFDTSLLQTTRGAGYRLSAES